MYGGGERALVRCCTALCCPRARRLPPAAPMRGAAPRRPRGAAGGGLGCVHQQSAVVDHGRRAGVAVFSVWHGGGHPVHRGQGLRQIARHGRGGLCRGRGGHAVYSRLERPGHKRAALPDILPERRPQPAGGGAQRTSCGWRWPRPAGAHQQQHDGRPRRGRRGWGSCRHAWPGWGRHA